MASKKDSLKGTNDRPGYIEAHQLAHRLIKKYEHLEIGERQGRIIADIKGLDLSDDVKERLLREFG
jgi:hypothetical protein